MNKRILMLAGLAGALFAGKAATTSTPADLEPVVGAVTSRADFAAEPTPTPAKSDSFPAGSYQVAIRARALGAGDFPRFVERPMRRRVKYGRHRWVMLG